LRHGAIKPLTSLRFFAAFMVLAHHYWGFAAGYGGVSFFYVLSGYVLTINYRGRVGTADGRLEFWWRRIARIYPLYLLTFLISIPVLNSGAHAVPFNVLALQSWIPKEPIYFSFNAPSWSISDEFFFYACFPLLLPLISVAPGKRVGAAAGVLIAVAAATALVHPQGLMDDPTHFIFYIFPPMRLVEFTFGIALALRPLKAGGLKAEIGALILALAGIALAYSQLPGSLTASIIFWPGAIAMVAVFSASEGPIAKLLSRRLFVLLGEASFALYMIHYPLRQYHFAGSIITAAVAVAGSVVLFLWFEKPAQRWMLNLPLGRVPVPAP
jgi:peptidoglycan/LPS O-acetylase OafA/YrhL